MNIKKEWQITEEVASSYLCQKKYQIIERNYTIHKVEIDIIAYKNNVLYLFEVKKVKKRNHERGYPFISYKQLKRYKEVRQKIQIDLNAFISISIGFLVYDENNTLINFCESIF